MKLVFRLLWLLLSQSRRSRLHLLEPCETRFRVLPNDLDVLLHLNNGVYLTLADLGRVDLLLRCNLYQRIRTAGWYPVVTATTIRYRRSLRLWQPFTITTRVLGWDERSAYLEQVFSSGGEQHAVAVIEACILRRAGGRVGIDELMALVDWSEPSPPLPDWVRIWQSGLREQAA